MTILKDRVMLIGYQPAHLYNQGYRYTRPAWLNLLILSVILLLYATSIAPVAGVGAVVELSTPACRYESSF
jgi:hypothetical protein